MAIAEAVDFGVSGNYSKGDILTKDEVMKGQNALFKNIVDIDGKLSGVTITRKNLSSQMVTGVKLAQMLGANDDWTDVTAQKLMNAVVKKMGKTFTASLKGGNKKYTFVEDVFHLMTPNAKNAGGSLSLCTKVKGEGEEKDTFCYLYFKVPVYEMGIVKNREYDSQNEYQDEFVYTGEKCKIADVSADKIEWGSPSFKVRDNSNDLKKEDLNKVNTVEGLLKVLDVEKIENHIKKQLHGFFNKGAIKKNFVSYVEKIMGKPLNDEIKEEAENLARQNLQQLMNAFNEYKASVQKRVEQDGSAEITKSDEEVLAYLGCLIRSNTEVAKNVNGKVGTKAMSGGNVALFCMGGSDYVKTNAPAMSHLQIDDMISVIKSAC